MEELQALLKIIGDETRFKIINLLLNHDFCVGALARCLGISGPAVSQHLQVLRRAGLVRGEKRGYWTHYSVEREMLLKIADELKKMATQEARPQYTCSRECSAIDATPGEGRESNMCRCTCHHPEKLKGKPGECTPEQIKECHGDAKHHPCAEEE